MGKRKKNVTENKKKSTTIASFLLTQSTRSLICLRKGFWLPGPAVPWRFLARDLYHVMRVTLRRSQYSHSDYDQ